MYKKKPSTDNNALFATENEFHTLLAIHNEIKKSIYKMFPYIKEQIIETLFSILSSQALLYDQIIRKSVLLQGSITKQTQITKLVQGNKQSFEKKIQEHLNSFNPNYESPTNESKPVELPVMTSQGKLIDNSKEDSTFFEQESIYSKLKKKIKLGKTQNIRTNSAGSINTINHYDIQQHQQHQHQHQNKQHQQQQSSQRKILKNRQPPHTEKKETKRLKPKMPSSNKKHIVFSKEKPAIYKKINIQIDNNNTTNINRDNYRSNNTQDSLYASQAGKRSALSNNNRCLTERKTSDNDIFEREFKVYPLMSYQSFPINRSLRRIGSKPTKYTKYLLKKYHDVVDSYEKIETEEDDLQRQSLFHSQIISRTDFNKKTNELQNSTQSIIITDYNKSKNTSVPKNRNCSCCNQPKPTKNIYNYAWK